MSWVHDTFEADLYARSSVNGCQTISFQRNISRTEGPRDLKFEMEFYFGLNWIHASFALNALVCSSVSPSHNKFLISRYLQSVW